MGKMTENPRYRVVSFRVTDEEFAEIRGAQEAGGLTPDAIRDLVLSAAQGVSVKGVDRGAE